MYNSYMDDEYIILNDIAKAMKESGKNVRVFREGRGVLGDFTEIKRAGGTFDYTCTPPRRNAAPAFWSVNFVRGAELKWGTATQFYSDIGSEILIKSAYENLEVRKISANEVHIIIPR